MHAISYRTRNFLVAAALGILAVALTLIYTAHARQSHKPTPVGTSTVLVAVRDIPIGTPGSELATTEWTKSVKVAADQVVEGAVTSPAQLATLVAIQPTYRDEQISARRFGSTQQEGLLSELHGRLRVLQLPGDSNQLLAGTLKVGNRVDLVGSIKNPESGVTHYASVAVRNMLVVEAPDHAPSASVSGSTTSVQLLLTTNQAQRVFWIEKNADWSLLLRPSVHALENASPPVNSAGVLEAVNGK
jgi:Flp pilus assembly protein CpaB